MRVLVVIPARWGSTRFPGKPLARIAGRSMLERVIALARDGIGARADVDLLVATDDARVAGEAERVGCGVVMTDAVVTTGSGRALAAAAQLPHRPDAIVNVQGDAPFLSPDALPAILDALAAGAQVATPVVRLDWDALDALRAHKVQEPFSGTTCVTDHTGRALWFSKQIIPAIRDEATLRAQPLSPVLRHLGLYGYATAALERFEALPLDPLERLEGLEQLRLLTAGIPVQTVTVTPAAIAMSGIDTLADVALAEALIARHGDPFPA